MKILEINKFYFPKGGADKHFLDVIRLLKKHGHQTAVFSMEHPENKDTYWKRYFLSKVGYTEEYNFWEKLKGAGRMFFSFEAKRKINRILDDFQPDIVHIHNIYHQLSPAILFEIKKRGIPAVMTVHDYKIISPNYSLFHNGNFYDRCRNGKYYRCFLDKCVKNSYAKSFLAMLEIYWHNKILKTYEKNIDLYIAPSEWVKNILVQWGIDKNKIEVLPHFIFNEEISAKTISKSADNEKYGLYLGRISHSKGVDGLIKLFKSLNFKLYLAGNMEDGLKVKNEEKIKYLGFLNSAQIKSFIQNSLFVISPSRLPETFGLIAMEAIAEGKPFVGFKSGAYSEIIHNGKNGFLAENEKEMKEIIKEIINGKLKFDSLEIKKEARDKYDAERYYKNLRENFNKCLDKI